MGRIYGLHSDRIELEGWRYVESIDRLLNLRISFKSRKPARLCFWVHDDQMRRLTANSRFRGFPSWRSTTSPDRDGCNRVELANLTIFSFFKFNLFCVNVSQLLEDLRIEVDSLKWWVNFGEFSFIEWNEFRDSSSPSRWNGQARNMWSTRSTDERIFGLRDPTFSRKCRPFMSTKFSEMLAFCLLGPTEHQICQVANLHIHWRGCNCPGNVNLRSFDGPSNRLIEFKKLN